MGHTERRKDDIELGLPFILAFILVSSLCTKREDRHGQMQQTALSSPTVTPAESTWIGRVGQPVYC